MALRGNLKDFSLPDVFQLVTFSRKTGVLRIARENGDHGSVWFRDGDVFFAQSNWHAELLGERLVRAQRLTPQALARALDIRAAEPEGGRRLGQILVDEGYLTDKVLEAFVSEQIQETIFDIMRWDEGEFDFEAMPEAVEEDIGLSVSIENVIMEGSRRLEEWARIRKKVPSMDVVFKMATAPGEGTFEISLKPTEWNLLLLVDGTRSVADLAHSTHRTDFEVARIIYGLFSAGLLEFASDEEVERLRAERDEREAKLAIIEAERRQKEEAAKAATEARDAALAAAAERRRAETQTSEAPAAVAEVAVSSEPVEEPEFLAGGLETPTAADAAALEEMMGAVLGQAAAPAAPVEAPREVATPHVPAEEPAFMAVEHAEETDLPMVPVPSVEDLLTDFPELRQSPESVEQAAAAVAEALIAETPPVVELQTPQAPEPAFAAEPVPVEPTADVAIAPAIEVPQAVEIPAVETPPALEPQPEALLELLAETPAVLETPEPTPVPETLPVPEASPAAYAMPDTLAEPIPAEFAVAPAEETPLVPPAEPFDSAVLTASPELLEQAMPEPAPEPTEAPVAEAPIEAPLGEPAATSFAEPAPEAAADEVPPVADFERDLMALGLGEMPLDLGGPSPLAESAGAPESPAAEVAEPASEFAWVAEPEAPADPGTAPFASEAEAELAAISELAELAAPEVDAPPVPEASQTEAPDFSELLESLDIDAASDVAPSAIPDAAAVEFEPLDFDEDLLGEVAGESGGVISTDAFLEDITIDDVGFSGEMTDELSALTGATRPTRPQTSVNRIPDPASGEVLHRDTRVDRDTLLRIIDGIKNL